MEGQSWWSIYLLLFGASGIRGSLVSLDDLFLSFVIRKVFLAAGYSGGCVCNEHGEEMEEHWCLRHPRSVFSLKTAVLSVSRF